MKSKSTSTKVSAIQKQKLDQSYDFHSYNGANSFDFVGLYKTAAETSRILEKNKINDTNTSNNKKNNVTSEKRERSPYKNRKKRKQEVIELSQINIDASSLNSNMGARAHSNNSKNNNTPNLGNTEQTRNVKSIMKNTSLTDQSEDSARSNISSGKPKKRNKSVSFMLEDNEEVVIKRTKSDYSIKNDKSVETTENVRNKKKISKNTKKSQQSEKENVNKQNMDMSNTPLTTQEKKTKLKAETVVEPASPLSMEVVMQTQEKRKKFKRVKKQKPESSQSIEADSNSAPASEKKFKKLKNKKVNVAAAENEEEIGEPHSKTRKIDTKPDIVGDLENLSIGDNAHTLTSLLDEMTVVDKDKQKKLRQKNKKKKEKLPNKEKNENSEDGNEKEKIKWNRRKWNKDKKGDLNDDTLNTVVVENLPLKIMLNYKKMLTDHFLKYGLIKKIGLAEVYPTEDSKPVFTTTVNFYSDGAAQQALKLNNTEFEGSRIRVKHPLPKTETTVVVRSYAELTDQNISSTFLCAGKIRSIRHLVKGKKSMATAFVEFASPEAVKFALTKMADIKIGGKKIHIAKFEPRFKKKKVIEAKNDGDSAADADSEHSND